MPGDARIHSANPSAYLSGRLGAGVHRTFKALELFRHGSGLRFGNAAEPQFTPPATDNDLHAPTVAPSCVGPQLGTKGLDHPPRSSLSRSWILSSLG